MEDEAERRQLTATHGRGVEVGAIAEQRTGEIHVLQHFGGCLDVEVVGEHTLTDAEA